LITIRLNLLR